MSMEDQSGDVEHLASQYTDAAIRHGVASRDGDARGANRAYEELSAIADALRARGPDGELSLLGLLVHPQIEVRGWAAAHVLSFAPDRALPVLEKIASGPASLDELNAKMILRQWQDGSFRTP
jgi:hypothetical protein